MKNLKTLLIAIAVLPFLPIWLIFIVIYGFVLEKRGYNLQEQQDMLDTALPKSKVHILVIIIISWIYIIFLIN